jgi:hypothetical protein
MRVRMKVDVSGARNGVSWPARGETVELPDSEGADLCASGLAVPVPESEGAAEQAIAVADSEQAVPPTPEIPEKALTTETAAAVTKNPPAKKTAARKTVAKKAGTPRTADSRP